MSSRRPVSVLALAALGAAGIVGVLGPGRVLVPSPPLDEWYRTADDVDLIAGALIVAVGAVSLYLVVLAASAAIARTLRWRPASWIVSVLAIGPLRGVAAATAVALAVGPAAGAAVPDDAPAATIVRLPDRSEAIAVDGGTVVATPVERAARSPTPTEPAVGPAVEISPPLDADDGALTTWTVRPGDHFWSIAHEVAGEDAGPDYWLRLVAANRDRLVDPGNADLVLPGQELLLPPTD